MTVPKGLVAEAAAIDALTDRYEGAVEVGRGAFGIVYRATRRSDGTIVAIKVLRDDVARGVGSDRFMREISIESHLSHPNIAPILDSGTAADLPFFVAPFATDGTLRDRLDRGAELSLDEALSVARGVAAALDYAGARGIVHRDVKPDNIVLNGDRVFLIDFGIARVLGELAGERLTQSGITLGTPAYMSPEQASGVRQLDARSDQYALACVVQEMLTGDPPFAGRSERAVIARQRGEPPTSVRIVRPTLPASVEYALLRTLSKSPGDRFATAMDFVRAMEAPPPASWRSPVNEQRRERRRRNMIRFVGLAVVAASIVAVTMLRPHSPTPDRKKVVLFPVVDVDRPTENAGLSVALAMMQSLVHAEPLVGLDGWTYLEAKERADARLVTARAARDVARRQGARYYVTGSILRTGDSATISLQLFDAATEILVTQERASGQGDLPSVVQSGMRAYSLLLPRLLDPGRTVDLSRLLNRSKSSLALWIQGEVAYRMAHFDEALALFQRATAEDSAFATAELRGAQAASWLSDATLAERLVGLAIRNDSLLAPGHRMMARGFDAYLRGAADSAVRLLTEAVKLTPTGAEAPMLLGEVYYHLIPSDWSGDSTAARHFAAASARDTAFTPSLVHLAEIALRAGDVRAAGEAIERFRANAPDTTMLRQLVLMRQCVGGSSTDWVSAARGNATAVTQAAHQLVGGARQPRCAEQAFRAILAVDTVPRSPDRWHAVVGLQGLLATLGRSSDARQVIDDEVARGFRVASTLYEIDAEAGIPMNGADTAFAALVTKVRGEDLAGASALTRWAMALHHARLRDTARVRRVEDGLWRLVDSSKTRADSTRADSLFARAVTARRKLLAGDTTGAIAALRALHSTAPTRDLIVNLFEPLAAERMLLARLLFARGDVAGASRVAAVLDHPQPVSSLPYLAESLQLRARGTGASAADAARRLRALRGTSSP